MSMGSTPRHARTAGDLGFAVQFNAETCTNLSNNAVSILAHRLRRLPNTETVLGE